MNFYNGSKYIGLVFPIKTKSTKKVIIILSDTRYKKELFSNDQYKELAKAYIVSYTYEIQKIEDFKVLMLKIKKYKEIDSIFAINSYNNYKSIKRFVKYTEKNNGEIFDLFIKFDKYIKNDYITNLYKKIQQYSYPDKNIIPIIMSFLELGKNIDAYINILP